MYYFIHTCIHIYTHTHIYIYIYNNTHSHSPTIIIIIPQYQGLTLCKNRLFYYNLLYRYVLYHFSKYKTNT